MDKTKILFICLGNICRSPAANAIMQKYVDDAGLTDKFYIDSAGIGPWHVGQLPDKRMHDAAIALPTSPASSTHVMTLPTSTSLWSWTMRTTTTSAAGHTARPTAARSSAWPTTLRNTKGGPPCPTHTMAMAKTLSSPLTSLRTDAGGCYDNVEYVDEQNENK